MPDNVTLLEKSLPHSEEAEMAVLGAMLFDKNAVAPVIEILDDSCFYKESHREIYKAIIALFDQNEPPTGILVAEELKRRGVLEGVGGPYYLARLADSVATSADVDRHARIVFERAIRRRLIQATTQIAKRGIDGREEIAELLDAAEEEIFRISERRLRGGFVPARDVLRPAFQIVEDLHNRGSGLMGISTGFVDLDRQTSGLQAGDLIIVAGRPSMGKTSFALNIAEYVAVERQGGVAFFSIEMSKEQLVLRLLSSRARVNSHLMRTGKLSSHDFDVLSRAASDFTPAPLFIDDSPTLSILELRAKARRLRAEHEIGLIVVDYLQLIHGSGRFENRQQEISQISRSLKALAKELSVPVVALSQLRRPAPAERRSKDERPQLSDLRESGALEQDADVVLFVFRQWSNNPEDRGKYDDTVGEIIIGKQRNGPTGTVKLTFLKEFTTFVSYSPRQAIPAAAPAKGA